MVVVADCGVAIKAVGMMGVWGDAHKPSCGSGAGCREKPGGVQKVNIC